MKNIQKEQQQRIKKIDELRLKAQKCLNVIEDCENEEKRNCLKIDSLLDIFNHHCFIKAVFFYSLGYSF
jgi:hypothetical protein